MPQQYWNQRFLSSTRGQIILLLRRKSRTVEGLAQELRLTDNAVRAHLATLERDGLVLQRGVRRGSGSQVNAWPLNGTCCPATCQHALRWPLTFSMNSVDWQNW